MECSCDSSHWLLPLYGKPSLAIVCPYLVFLPILVLPAQSPSWTQLCLLQWTAVSNSLDWIKWINIPPTPHPLATLHSYLSSSFFWTPPSSVSSVLSTFHGSDKMSTRLRAKANPPLCLSPLGCAECSGNTKRHGRVQRAGQPVDGRNRGREREGEKEEEARWTRGWIVAK